MFKHVDIVYHILIRYAQPGYTNANKHRLSPDGNAMSRLLKPEKGISGNYMTAKADFGPYHFVDSRTGEPFHDDESSVEVNQYKIPGEFISYELRVNRFMLMSRLAQNWLMDFYSSVLDQ